jgi:hypothetical protein
VTAIDSAVRAPGSAPVSAPVRRPALDSAARDMALVTAAALPLAMANPVAASIGALALFGLAHTFLELRWVLARFRPVFTPAFLATTAGLATVIALARLTGAPRQVEIVAGFALVGAGLLHAGRTGRIPPASVVVAAGALTAALALSLQSPGLYGIVLAHLHNVVTAVLVWQWAGERKGFRAGIAAAYAAVPALVLSGAVDFLLPAPAVPTGAARLLAGSIVPPQQLSTAMGVRIVAVFAFLQLVHYGIWCWLLPRRGAGGRAVASGKGPWLAAAVMATGLLALVFRTDYATGRTLYGSLATYHAYLELPVVLVLLGGARNATAR